MVEKQVKQISEQIIRQGFGYLPFDDWGLDEDITEYFEEIQKRRKAIAEEVLSVFDKSRENDRILDWECLRAEFPTIKISSDKDTILLSIPKRIIKFLPSPETYTRVRRKFNHNGQYLPTSYATIVRRLKRQKAMRQYYASEKYQDQEYAGVLK